MGMQLGFVSAILPDETFEDVCRTAAEIGYDCVEIMCWPLGKAERRYAGVTHIQAESLDDAAVARIHQTCADCGIEISGLGYYPNPLSPNEAEASVAIEHLKSVIDAAQRLGLGVVNSFVGRDWHKSVDDNWDTFLSVWRPLIQHAEQAGVKVGIENCPMSFTMDEWPGGKNLATTPKIWERMFSDIPSANFGLNYDPSHMIWQHMDYLQPIRDFADRIFHVHAKDVRIDRERLNQVGIMATPAEYHTPKLPGLGDIDWGKFFSCLGDSGYQGAVCVEVEDRVYEGSLGSRQASLQQSHNYLRNFVVAFD